MATIPFYTDPAAESVLRMGPTGKSLVFVSNVAHVSGHLENVFDDQTSVGTNFGRTVRTPTDRTWRTWRTLRTQRTVRSRSVSSEEELAAGGVPEDSAREPSGTACGRLVLWHEGRTGDQRPAGDERVATASRSGA